MRADRGLAPRGLCREAWGRVYGLGLLISPRHIMSEFYVTTTETQVSWGKKEGFRGSSKPKENVCFLI